jgi:hypothetical protein
LCYTSSPMNSPGSEPLTAVMRRRLVTPEVKESRDAFVEALSDAVRDSGLFRHEAEGRLSLFLAYLWDDLEPIVNRLPVARFTERLALETMPTRKEKRGRPRKDDPTPTEEWAAL